MSKLTNFDRRKNRVRRQLRKSANGRPRISIFRSNKHIYAQVIDDVNHKTVAAASTADPDIRKKIKNGWTCDAAAAIGKAVGERAVKAGVKEVVFDRGAYVYHGRVKALADAARESGLSF